MGTIGTKRAEPRKTHLCPESISFPCPCFPIFPTISHLFFSTSISLQFPFILPPLITHPKTFSSIRHLFPLKSLPNHTRFFPESVTCSGNKIRCFSIQNPLPRGFQDCASPHFLKSENTLIHLPFSLSEIYPKLSKYVISELSFTFCYNNILANQFIKIIQHSSISNI